MYCQICFNKHPMLLTQQRCYVVTQKKFKKKKNVADSDRALNPTIQLVMTGDL